MTTFSATEHINTLSEDHVRIQTPLTIVSLDSDEQEVTDFVSQLEKAVSVLEQAIAKRIEVAGGLTSLKDTLAKRGWFGAITSSLNGKSEKELAEMIGGLGESLEFVQTVLDIMLKVQTKKNKLLHAFNDALVEKISKIKSDTHTLDENQKLAVSVFLGALQEQIYDQIRQQEMVEIHQKRIEDIDLWRSEKNASDTGVVEQLSVQERNLRNFKDQLEATEITRVSWQKMREDNEKGISKRMTELESNNNFLKQQNDKLAEKLILVEQDVLKSKSVTAILARNAIPVMALIGAIGALIFSS